MSVTEFPIVCANGCPEGAEGQHKFSCEWTGLDGPRYPDIEVALNGEDGNIFFIIGRVTRALRRAGHADQISYFTNHITSSESYDEALERVGQWVSTT